MKTRNDRQRASSMLWCCRPSYFLFALRSVLPWQRQVRVFTCSESIDQYSLVCQPMCVNDWELTQHSSSAHWLLKTYTFYQ